MGDFLRSTELSTAGVTVSDAQGKLLISMVEAQVREFCGWTISQETVVDQKVRPVGDNLFLPTLYLTAVTSVSRNGTTFTDGVGYQWRQNGQVELYGLAPASSYVWPSPDFLVSYTHGYPSGSRQLLVVKQVVLAMVSRLSESPDQRLISSQVGGITEQWAAPPQVPSGLTYAEQGALAPFVLPVVA